jgi:hypothetical protein
MEPKITVRKADNLQEFLAEKKTDEVNELPVKKIVSVKESADIQTIQKDKLPTGNKKNKLTNYLDNLSELKMFRHLKERE